MCSCERTLLSDKAADTGEREREEGGGQGTSATAKREEGVGRGCAVAPGVQGRGLRELLLQGSGELGMPGRVALLCHGSDTRAAEGESRGGGGGGGGDGAGYGCNPEGDRGTFSCPPPAAAAVLPRAAAALCDKCGGEVEGGGGGGNASRRGTGTTSRIGDVTVVSPGMLSSGRFCLLTMTRRDPERRWFMSHSEFLDLYL